MRCTGAPGLLMGHLPSAVAKADVVFIAVGTPSRRGDGFADLTYVYEVARQIAHAVRISRSWSQPSRPFPSEPAMRSSENRQRHRIAMRMSQSCPIRSSCARARLLRLPVRPRHSRHRGQACDRDHERSVPAAFSQQGADCLLRKAHRRTHQICGERVSRHENLVHQRDCRSVETGAEMLQDVALGIGLDKRIGSNLLHAGPGFGGSCFPKDTVALVKSAQDHDSSYVLVETTIAVNDHENELWRHGGWSMPAAAMCAPMRWSHGLTPFQTEYDKDARGALAPAIVREGLEDAGATVGLRSQGHGHGKDLLPTDRRHSAMDPMRPPRRSMPLFSSPSGTHSARCVPRLRSRMRQPVFVDLRNVYRKMN